MKITISNTRAQYPTSRPWAPVAPDRNLITSFGTANSLIVRKPSNLFRFKREKLVQKLWHKLKLSLACHATAAPQRVEIELQKCPCHSPARTTHHRSKTPDNPRWNIETGPAMYRSGSSLIAPAKRSFLCSLSGAWSRRVVYFIRGEGGEPRIKGFAHPFTADICFSGLRPNVHALTCAIKR